MRDSVQYFKRILLSSFNLLNVRTMRQNFVYINFMRWITMKIFSALIKNSGALVSKIADGAELKMSVRRDSAIKLNEISF